MLGSRTYLRAARVKPTDATTSGRDEKRVATRWPQTYRWQLKDVLATISNRDIFFQRIETCNIICSYKYKHTRTSSKSILSERLYTD